MKRSILKDPYTTTSLLFLVIVIIGWWLWQWREGEYAFLLLLYFIIVIGIKLDQIATLLADLTIKSKSSPQTKSSSKDTNVKDNTEEISADLRPNDIQHITRLLEDISSQLNVICNQDQCRSEPRRKNLGTSTARRKP